MKFSDIPDGATVTVTNIPWGEESDGRIYIEVSGKLIKADPDDKKDNHYLRIKDDNEGLSGICFYDKNVKDVEKLPSGRIVIVVRD